MKLILVIFSAALAGALSIPLDSIEPRWALARDGEGKTHLLDLNPVDAEAEPAFEPEVDMFFLLFTRDNPTTGQRVTWTRESIEQSNFRANGQVRFMIHGWGASASSGENPRATREFLALADHNVIVVDWSVGAGSNNYITARNRVGPAGEVVARLIDFLDENGFASHSNIHIIGHSLGAHVAGHTGKSVVRGRVNAIFGTDPAGPLFNVANPDGRLDIGDAVYTEAIHTNAGTLGFDEPITHASFYPNWGSSQPGCGVDIGGGCAHGRATFLYAESINSNSLVGRQCTGYDQIVAQNCPGTGVTGILGGDSAKSIRGVFFMTTNDASPFGQG